jgi:uncharacterized Zn finger protein/DNA-binding transcriptional regulator YiaG
MPPFGWKPYVPVAKRRARAEREMKKLAKQGDRIEPVVVDGRKIAHTFWGAAWCKHLEQFSDYSNRLPRGRTYVRNGSVCHLAIEKGRIQAIVSGSELYRVTIEINPLPAANWKRLRAQCTGQIGSLLELLQGRFSDQVMQIVSHRDQGLFPSPGEIHMQCSCPDWAGLCKHLAAVLYGVGARLDQQPELLFRLRGVDHQQLISADLDPTRITEGTGKGRRLAGEDLSGLFGVDLDDEPSPAPRRPRAAATKTAPKVPTPAPRPAEPAFTSTGPAIAALRERLGMNKSQFARLLGVSPPTITNWENKAGALNLHPDHLKSLVRASGLTQKQASARLARVSRQRGA